MVPPQPSSSAPQFAPTPPQVLGTQDKVERAASETVSSAVFSASDSTMSEAPSAPSVAGAEYVTVTSTRCEGCSTSGVAPTENAPRVS
jgi:hypothetical protein